MVTIKIKKNANKPKSKKQSQDQNQNNPFSNYRKKHFKNVLYVYVLVYQKFLF